VVSESKREKSQSFEHMRMKLYFYENLPLSNQVVRLEEEYKIGDQIADVYFELENGEKIAIEIQHSKITEANLTERTLKYTKRGIHVLWILNGKSFNKYPQNQDGKRISLLESKLHKMYNGRVYYLNMDSKGIISGVYALSYFPYFNIKDVMYKKKSISKKSIYCQEIQSLKLKCRSMKYKLALFEDEDVKSLCEEDIFKILKAYCMNEVKHTPNNNETYLIIPIIKIVSALRPRYGFFLVYDVLQTSRKRARNVKITKFGFMKDKDNKVKESIKIQVSDYI